MKITRHDNKYTGRRRIPVPLTHTSEKDDRMATPQEIARSLPWYRRPYSRIPRNERMN